MLSHGCRGRSEHQDAFALIELLVILAVVAILAAMLFPVFAQAREKVRAFVCLANLRQIGTACTLYAQDYDEKYAAPDPTPYRWLPDVHFSYLQNWRVWICPSDLHARLWDSQWDSPSFRVRTSYFWNAYIFQGDAADWRRSLTLSAVTTTATVPLWFEGYANHGWFNDATPISDPSPYEAALHNVYGDSLNASSRDPTAAPCAVHYDEKHLDVVHSEGGNYIFADNHAKWMRPDAFITQDLLDRHGALLSDVTDPLLTSGARALAIARPGLCPVLCCPQNIGTPPGDGQHPWFRP
jgi:prepilin-type processing-associated H-X9-DG protein